MLRASDKQRLEWKIIQAALQLEFPPEEAERQIDTAIDWGRYAEILAYDDSTDMIYIEPHG